MRRTILILFICVTGCESQSNTPTGVKSAGRLAAGAPPLTAAQAAVGDVEENSVGMTMVPIPAGEFVMGSPPGEEGRFDNEIPHLVRITRAFYMSATEVTQAQWTAVMGTQPWQGDQLFVREGADYPATFVSWNDAVEFCRKLSRQEGLTYRLPTEAEWEYACRAGSTTAFCFGDDVADLHEYAWFVENAYDAGEAHAHRVGRKLPNAWGLYDMHGNVWEWCSDWHGDYPAEPVIDPTGPAEGSGRVIRSGRWVSFPKACRSADRIGNDPELRDVFLGFRVARSLPWKTGP